MAEKFVQSGIPSVSSKNGYSTDDGKALIGVSENAISLSNVISNALRLTTDPVKIIIDPNNLKAFVSTGTEFSAAFEAALGDNGGVTFTPTAGQDGRSLEWDAALEGDVTQRAFVAASADVVAAAKPKMTVESLVARLLASVDKQDGIFVVIDQGNGTVKLLKDETGPDAEAALAGVTPSATRSAVVALEPVVAESVATALKFEGGAV